MPTGFVDYKLVVSHDAETGQEVAQVPALGISDYGPGTAALDSVCQMTAFHLKCLVDEGEEIPTEPDEDAGLFIRVRVPSPSG